MRSEWLEILQKGMLCCEELKEKNHLKNLLNFYGQVHKNRFVQTKITFDHFYFRYLFPLLYR